MTRSIAEWCDLIHEEAVSKGFWSNPCQHPLAQGMGPQDSSPSVAIWCPDCGTISVDGGDIWTSPKERDNNRPRPEQYLLFISEIAEAFEEYRKPGQPDAYVNHNRDGLTPVDIIGMSKHYPQWDGKLLKPEGELVECADIMIRLLDDIGHVWGSEVFEAAMEWKFAYNKTRGFRHGGKKA